MSNANTAQGAICIQNIKARCLISHILYASNSLVLHKNYQKFLLFQPPQEYINEIASWRKELVRLIENRTERNFYMFGEVNLKSNWLVSLKDWEEGT